MCSSLVDQLMSFELSAIVIVLSYSIGVDRYIRWKVLSFCEEVVELCYVACVERGALSIVNETIDTTVNTSKNIHRAHDFICCLMPVLIVIVDRGRGRDNNKAFIIDRSN